jgi:poly-gamma-glutamate synthesis protein (capsule biosynthesis protein)
MLRCCRVGGYILSVTPVQMVNQGFWNISPTAYHGFIRRPPPEAIAVMQRYSRIMPVVAMPHAGKEYVAAPDQLKTELYRSMIDSGADVVIGDHPHWVQTTESYKGRLIVYSMGNFIFDQQLRPEMTRSAGIQVLLSVDGAEKKLLTGWTELAKTCTTYHDDCLIRAEQQKLTKLPYTMKYGVVGTDDYGKIVKPASPEVQAGILERLNWSQTMTQLQPPYAAL